METFGNEELELPVEPIWELIKGIEIKLISVKSLVHCLDFDVWGGITPNELYNMSPSYDVTRHIKRTEKTDLTYAIELWPVEWYGGFIVANGYHRLLKASRMGIQNIRARYVPVEYLERGFNA
jgi:hypothetical protein